MKQVLRFVASLALAFSAAVIGNIGTRTSLEDWYPTLDKPPFNPPNEIFGPVWTVLYILMGISFFLIWNEQSKKGRTKRQAYQYFLVQLCLNALWSLVFFGLQAPLLAFAVIGLLGVTLVCTMRLFLRIRLAAAYLLVPYLLWIMFATLLNMCIAYLN